MMFGQTKRILFHSMATPRDSVQETVFLSKYFIPHQNERAIKYVNIYRNLLFKKNKYWLLLFNILRSKDNEQNRARNYVANFEINTDNHIYCWDKALMHPIRFAIKLFGTAGKHRMKCGTSP